jgi:hypothetical protein
MSPAKAATGDRTNRMIKQNRAHLLQKFSLYHNTTLMTYNPKIPRSLEPALMTLYVFAYNTWRSGHLISARRNSEKSI